jgi:hypothetical protein
MKIKIIATSHHRNGVCGEPFDICLFEDDDKTVKVSIDFGQNMFAVLQVDKLIAGDIAFGSNSWRGDRYMHKIRELAETIKPSYTEGSVFIRYPLKQEVNNDGNSGVPCQ